MERRGRSVDDAAALALHRSGVAEEIIRFYRLRDTPGSPVEHRAILSWVFPVIKRLHLLQLLLRTIRAWFEIICTDATALL